MKSMSSGIGASHSGAARITSAYEPSPVPSDTQGMKPATRVPSGRPGAASRSTPAKSKPRTKGGASSPRKAAHCPERIRRSAWCTAAALSRTLTRPGTSPASGSGRLAILRTSGPP